MKFKKLKTIISMAMMTTMLLGNSSVYAAIGEENNQFSWDNASVYFTMTDRFYNGDTSNDHAYGRSTDEVDAGNYKTRLGTFHGGDLKGLQDKVEEGYFDKLGINAIWITAPYEQIHGALCGQGFKHYAYHGYYALDFTNVDGNMGTAKDLENFIDAAHSHGIRVIFDVVMNHAGYADAKTADEYGFGKLSSDWKDIYYRTNESDYKWFNDYSGEAANNGGRGMMDTNGDWSTNWWGPDWVRAVSQRFSGYEGSESGDDKTICSSGLPDFKTESTKEVDLPGLLKNKWKKEGTYNEKMNSLNSYFNRTGKPRTVTNYLVKWLSDWVREYGVDGFRCDTAKHVDISCWKALKDECKVALNDWRANNPDKPGAKWKDDFWMTGEHWGHGVGKDSYFTSGAFDSMINFDYQGSAFASTSQIEGIYSRYASMINSDPSFNVLSYISSHDKGLSRGNMITAGTNLLLLPGGVQTYYGDESGRKAVGSNQEQSWRSDMNWGSMDTKELAHWQKVGQFRTNHMAVGAGQHNKISDAPYTFSRTYNANGISDKVVVSMPGKSGSTTVKVGNVFNDGDGVRDAYTGAQYVVSGGSVTVNAGENGLVLLESNGNVTPTVGISTPGQSFYSDTLDITLNATKIKNAKYKINDGEYQSYEDGQVITIGSDINVGESVTVTVIGTDADGNTVGPKTEVYNKVPEPTGLTIYVKNDSWKSEPNVYAYSEDGNYVTKITGEWPGVAMTPVKGHDGWYKYTTKATVNAKVIFNGSWGQYPGQNQPGMELSGTTYIENNEVLQTAPFVENEDKKGTVTVKYIDEETSKEIADSVVLTGKVGADYTVAQKSIEGYDFSSVEGVTSGKYAEGNATVTYKYKKHVVAESFKLTGLTTDLASPQNVGTKITIKASSNRNQGVYYKFWAYTPDEEWIKLSDYSYSNSIEWIPDMDGNYIIMAYAKDENGKTSYTTIDYSVDGKPVFVNENNSKISYSGFWIFDNDSRFLNGTRKSTNIEGSSLAFNFRGEGLKILSTSAPDKGVAEVILDGKVYSADMYSETPKFKDVVFEKNGLSSDIHSLILKYSGLQSYKSTGTAIDVEGFEILNGDIL